MKLSEIQNANTSNKINNIDGVDENNNIDGVDENNNIDGMDENNNIDGVDENNTLLDDVSPVSAGATDDTNHHSYCSPLVTRIAKAAASFLAHTGYYLVMGTIEIIQGIRHIEVIDETAQFVVNEVSSVLLLTYTLARHCHRIHEIEYQSSRHLGNTETNNLSIVKHKKYKYVVIAYYLTCISANVAAFCGGQNREVLSGLGYICASGSYLMLQVHGSHTSRTHWKTMSYVDQSVRSRIMRLYGENIRLDRENTQLRHQLFLTSQSRSFDTTNGNGHSSRSSDTSNGHSSNGSHFSAISNSITPLKNNV